MPIIRKVFSVLFLTVAIAASAGRYYDLAVKAYQSGDYERCIELFEKKIPKEIKEERKNRTFNSYSWMPYIESTFALKDYRRAFHGITDDHRVINKKYYVDGKPYRLTPEILAAWDTVNNPELRYLHKKLQWEYVDDHDGFMKSPLYNHISRATCKPMTEIEAEAAGDFFTSANDNLRWGSSGRAFSSLRAAADFGHADALKIVASAYENGYIILSNNDTVSVAQNFDQARHYRELTVAKVPSEATYALVKLGEYYAEGNGVERDLHKAIQYYRRALECDTTVNMLSNAAYKQIANCYGELGDTAMFFNISREAVDRGYTWSLHNLGNCYKNGKGTPKDLKKAFETYSSGLDAKDGGSTSEACGYEVGVALLNGSGCERDSIKGIERIKEYIHVFPQVTNFILADANYKQARWSDAMKYCLAVAEGDSGFPKAALSRVCRWIAAMYTHGRGVTADENEARKWWKKAEEYGDDDAEIIRKLLGY